MNKELFFIIPDLKVGGAQKVLYFLINFLVRKKFKIKILVFDSKKNVKFKFLPEVKIISLNSYKESKNFFQKIFYNFIRIRRIRSEIKKNKSSTIISFLSTANILTLISSLGLKRKIMVNERNDPHNEKIPYIWKFLRFFLYNFASKIIKNIPDKKFNQKFFFLKKKIVFIPNPLMLSEVNLKLKKKRILLSVARLTYQKNINLLIQSFAKSNAIKKGWKLIVLGKGPEEYVLKKKCRELQISKYVIFKGFVKNISYWYKKAAIFVLSSRYEGMPNALIESMYFKSAVIGASIPGVKYFIKNKYNGLIFKNNKEEELTKCINYLIKNNKKRTQFSMNAYNCLKKRAKAEVFYKSWINLLND